MGQIEDGEGHGLYTCHGRGREGGRERERERERWESERERERERWESEREKIKLHTFDEGSLDRSSNFTMASAIVVAMFCR